jgi:hypothetical protein
MTTTMLARELRDAHASDPSGVYALIDQVALEPGDGPPTRVRLSGLFCVADGKRGSAYRTPRLGSIVYSLSPGEGEKQTGERARIEELRAVAGTGKVVAFGSRWKSLDLRVTPRGEAVERPPVFDQGIGVSVIENARYGAIGMLRSMPRIVSPKGDVTLNVHKHYGAMDQVAIVVDNPAGKMDGLRLLFEIERENGDVTASGPVALGDDGRTSHTQWVPYREGEVVTYRVRALHDDLPQVGVAVGRFTVRGKTE